MAANSEALEVALEALATAPQHAALVQAARSLAVIVDGPKFNAHAWHEYRMALENLMEATAHGGGDAFARLLDDMRAEVGDSAD